MGLFKKKGCCDMEIVEETTSEKCDCDCNCDCTENSKDKKSPASPKNSGGNLKAYIDVRHCGANQDHCKPMKECPNEAIEIIPDETSGFGHRFVVNEEKCDGCGACIDICCGDCMELR